MEGPQQAVEGEAVASREQQPAMATTLQRRGRGARLRRVARALCSGGAAIVVIALLGAGVAVKTGRLTLAPVLSASMQPSIRTGDLAVILPVASADLRVGDVISFYPPGDTSTPKLHRIASLTHDIHGLTITTRGDANAGNDPWTATLRGATAYRLAGVIPLLGWSTAWLGHLWIYLLLVLSGVLMGLAALNSYRREPGINGRDAAKGTTS